MFSVPAVKYCTTRNISCWKGDPNQLKGLWVF